MNILLDTNIIIPLEDTGRRLDSSFAELRKLAAEQQHCLFVHPLQIDDINRDKDKERKDIVLSRLKQYPKIENPPVLSEEERERLGLKESNDNVRQAPPQTPTNIPFSQRRLKTKPTLMLILVLLIGNLFWFVLWLLPSDEDSSKNGSEEIATVDGEAITRQQWLAAMEIAFVVSGKLDAYISMRLAPWDIGGGTVIAKEVGAVVNRVKI